MILVIDNYDSFTYNLVQLLGSLGAETLVMRNDAMTVEECAALQPNALVVSPGPGHPAGAGVSVPLIRKLLGTVPILGVCLGHQSLVSALGGRIERAPRAMHGKTSRVTHACSGLFAGIRSPCTVARYHSLAATSACLPAALTATALSEDDTIMAVEAWGLRAFGMQFHPESFLTPDGPRMVANFLSCFQ